MIETNTDMVEDLETAETLGEIDYAIVKSLIWRENVSFGLKIWIFFQKENSLNAIIV